MTLRKRLADRGMPVGYQRPNSHPSHYHPLHVLPPISRELYVPCKSTPKNSFGCVLDHPQHFNALPVMDEQRLRARLKDLSPSKRWVIGAAIFQESESETRTILLLKRAEHETVFPNAWELPGGCVEEADKTIAHAVKREVFEETSLSVAHIIGELEPMYWESNSKSNVQLNYVVKPNLEEHSDWRWAKLEELNSLYITPAMEKVVRDAFRFTVGSYLAFLGEPSD